MQSEWNEGNVIEVPLPSGGFGYGIIVKFPLVAFMSTRFDARPQIDDILGLSVLFRIWLMRKAIGRKGWSVIGNIVLPQSFKGPDTFYKFDVISKTFAKHMNGIETPANRDECIGLECAAVWDPSHVISRLEDHFAGRSNKWVQSLDARNR